MLDVARRLVARGVENDLQLEWNLSAIMLAKLAGRMAKFKVPFLVQHEVQHTSPPHPRGNDTLMSHLEVSVL